MTQRNVEELLTALRIEREEAGESLMLSTARENVENKEHNTRTRGYWSGRVTALDDAIGFVKIQAGVT